MEVMSLHLSVCDTAYTIGKIFLKSDIGDWLTKCSMFVNAEAGMVGGIADGRQRVSVAKYTVLPSLIFIVKLLHDLIWDLL
jgi:hypothetical protein